MNFQKLLLLFAVIVAFMAGLWMGFSAFFSQHLPHNLRPPYQEEVYSFDYVIVGAGTCGTVLASLLAELSANSVLLIEAGEQFGLLSKIPLLTTFQQKGINDWGFLSKPQRFSSRGLKEYRQALPRGKGIGGSSQLNFMVHFDAIPEDFERWSKEHNLTEWQWKAVHPFLEVAKGNAEDILHIHEKYSKLTIALAEAKKEFAHLPWRFRRSKYTVKRGLRFGVVQRFLQPAMEKFKNLWLLTNTMAQHIDLNEEKRVKSLQVSMRNEGKEHIFKVEIRKELIISAGAYQSPQLLLSSGIGDREKLRLLDIPLVHHLPQVGENLHDHFNQPLFVSIDVIGPTLNQHSLLDPFSIFDYLTTGQGHLGNFGVLGHMDTEKYGLTFFGAGAIDESALMSISNFKRQYFRALFPRYFNTSQEGFVLISTCLQPKSRGRVNVIASNTRLPPIIDPNYLNNESDLNCTIEAIRNAVKLVKSSAFESLRPRIHWPRIPECLSNEATLDELKVDRPSDEYLECVIRHVGLGSHHPGGSCSMGSTMDSSVVDSQFRVHGISGLRIIDASVLPTPLSGNPNSVLIAMALRGSAFILKSEKYGKG